MGEAEKEYCFSTAGRKKEPIGSFEFPEDRLLCLFLNFL